MAEADIVEEEVPVQEEAPTVRPLTMDETHDPIITLKGQQAAGQVDIGEGRYTPIKQEVQDDELLRVGEGDESKLLGTDPTITAQQAS